MAYLAPSALVLVLSASAGLKPRVAATDLLLETGTGIRDANSYVTVDYADKYFIGRRLYSSAWIVASRATKIAALKQATATLDSEFIWSGRTAVSVNQGLAWPFTDALDRYGVLVVGIPRQLKDAVCELALYLMAEDRLVARSGVGLKSLRVDTIWLTFDKDDAPQTFPGYISRMLAGLGGALRASGGIKTVRLYRV